MVSFIGLEGDVLFWLQSHVLEFINFVLKYDFRGVSGVDAVGLDRDYKVTAVLEEPLAVNGHDTGLVGLGDIGEDDVDHIDEHAVADRLPGVVDDGMDVGPLLAQVNEISPAPLRELNGIANTALTNDVTDMRHRGTRGGTEIEDLASGLHVDAGNASKDGGGELRPVWVPDPVFDLLVRCFIHDSDPLLIVDTLSGNHILGDEHILRSTGDKNALVTMRDHNGLGTAASTASSTSTTTTSSTSTETTSAATTSTETTTAKS